MENCWFKMLSRLSNVCVANKTMTNKIHMNNNLVVVDTEQTSYNAAHTFGIDTFFPVKIQWLVSVFKVSI